MKTRRQTNTKIKTARLGNLLIARIAKLKILLVIIICISISCNKAFFVDKTKIVHNGSGYLLFKKEFHNDVALLILSKDTSIDHFLSDTTEKRAYKLFDDACGFYGLKAVANKYLVDIPYKASQQNIEFTLEDSVFITTTTFKYLKTGKKTTEWKGPFEFIYKNKRYKIYVSDQYIGTVLQVTGNTM